MTRLTLVGAGHAHLEILRRMALHPPPELDTTIVSPTERAFYSGMIPGYLAGHYSMDDITADVTALARRAGVRCLIGCAAGLDPRARVVTLQDGSTIPHDLVSLNIGSLLAGSDGPPAGSAERIKPLYRVAGLRERLERLAVRSSSPARIVVVGAGAAGVEVAFAAAALMDGAGRPREVTIVDEGDQLLRGYGKGFARLAGRALDRHAIHRRLGSRVALAPDDRVELESGGTLPSDLTIWLTGPQGAPLLAGSGLPTEPRGFLWTDDSLQSIADRTVFAVGDCGTLAKHPAIAKSGVYAVREAPVLWHNLIAAARNQPLASYRPQRNFLSILNTSDGRALLRYGRVKSWSRWAWWLKDRIDRGFIGKYQARLESRV